MNNLFADIPKALDEEQFITLLAKPNVRIERILSNGQTSPEEGWYDQQENEWVLVLQGAGVIEFDDGERVSLSSGDHFNIEARRKHRVVWTDPEAITLWLAVFYK